MIDKHPPIPRRGGPIRGPVDLHLPAHMTLPRVVCSRPQRRRNRSRTWYHYVLTNGPAGPVYYYGGKCRDIDHGPGCDPHEPWPTCPPPRGTQ